MDERPHRPRPALVPSTEDVEGSATNPLERRRREAARFSARVRATVTLDSIGDGVLSIDLAGRITYLNPAAAAMIGWPSEAAVGQPIGHVFHLIDRETREPAQNPLRLAVQLNRNVGLTPNCLLVRSDGGELAIEDSAAPIRDTQGRVTGAVMVFRDVGAALEMSRQMSHMAQHDALTGLPNRLLLNDRLTNAIALGRRRQKPVAVGFLDIDQFKNVNDSLGHVVADRVLQSIAARLQESLRQSDTVSRYGGDEFVIALLEIEHANDAALVARKLLRAVALPSCIDSQEIHLTASLGVSLYPDHGDDAETLIAKADAAMYAAKRFGPGKYRLWDASLKARRSWAT